MQKKNVDAKKKCGIASLGKNIQIYFLYIMLPVKKIERKKLLGNQISKYDTNYS